MTGFFRITFAIILLSIPLFAGKKWSRQEYIPGKLTHFYLSEKGMASWYGGNDGFVGKETASGTIYDDRIYSMAHKTLPLKEVVCVVNPLNGKMVLMRVTDRGPYIPGRIADLSRRGMAKIGLLEAGTGLIEIYRTKDAIESSRK